MATVFNMTGSGGAAATQEKYVTITENGTVDVLPDEGKLLSAAHVTVDVSGGIEPRLPSAYQEVEYLESQHGGEEIVANLVATDVTRIELVSKGQRVMNAYAVILSLNGSSAGAGQWIAQEKESTPFYVTDTIVSSVGTLQKATTVYDKNSNTISINGEIHNSDLSGRGAVHILAKYFPTYTALYSCRIWTSALVRDLVPCVRKSDSKPGMYDLCGSICPLTGTPFYINAGTGEFLKGPNVTYSLQTITATENGEYTPSAGYIGFDKVTVNVSGGGSPRIPSAYTEVDYLGSSGTQYIDTGELQIDGIDIIFQYTTVGQSIFGARDAAGSNRFGLTIWDNQYHVMPPGYQLAQADTAVHRFVYGANWNWNMYLDNLLHTTGTDHTISRTRTMGLFGENWVSSFSSLSKCRIYAAKLYRGSTLVCDLVPCYRKTDGVCGMYDVTREVFLTNGGTGSFIQGPKVDYPLTSLQATTNGVYQPTEGYIGFDEVTVNVPQDEPDLVDVTITENGTYRHSGHDGYDTVTVNVSSGGSPARLPEEYQEVEWLGSTGTEYIDTEVAGSSDISIRMEFALTEALSTDTKIFGIHDGIGPTDLVGTNASKFRMLPYGDPWSDLSIRTDNVWHTVVFRDDLGRFFLDGQLIKTRQNSWSVELTYWLFSSNGDSKPTKMRLRSFTMRRISTNAALRTFIPCYRKADNKAGLYDMVSERFFQNSGSGAFTVGPDVVAVVEPLTVTQNGSYAASGITGYKPVVVNVPTGGSAGIKNSVGAYFGEMLGDLTTSLNVATTGHVRETALFIIMHRDTLSVPASWTFLLSVPNGSGTQFISLYKKQITAPAETFTVTQASAVRMCACIWYFVDDISIQLAQTQSMDEDSATYRYTLQAIYSSGMELDVINNTWSGDTAWTFSELLRMSGPTGLAYGASSINIRMLALMNPSAQDVVITANTSTAPSSDSMLQNRIHRFIVTTA